jgi:V/A-type H+-transporting ATPase subunit F
MQMLVVGHPEAVQGFALVGVRGKAVQTRDQVNAALDEALQMPNVGIVLVTQDAAALIEERMEQLRLRSTVPLIVEIPGPGGVREDRPPLNELIRRAIGVRI